MEVRPRRLETLRVRSPKWSIVPSVASRILIRANFAIPVEKTSRTNELGYSLSKMLSQWIKPPSSLRNRHPAVETYVRAISLSSYCWWSVSPFLAVRYSDSIWVTLYRGSRTIVLTWTALNVNRTLIYLQQELVTPTIEAWKWPHASVHLRTSAEKITHQLMLPQKFHMLSELSAHL